MWVGLLLVAAFACSGCRELLGFDDPTRAAGDARGNGDGAQHAIDARDGQPAAPYCDPADVTLVACYEFENTLADSSSHHLDPDVMMNVSYAAGEVGEALAVGASTEVDVADSTAFDVGAYTIEAWVRVPQLPATGSRAGVLDCEGQYGLFVMPDGTLGCFVNSSSISGGTIPLDTWTHVACTDDGTTLHAYIDGSLLSVKTTSGPISTSGTTGITIGGNNPPGGGQPLDGLLDELRLLSVARTAQQICADAGGTSC